MKPNVEKAALVTVATNKMLGLVGAHRVGKTTLADAFAFNTGALSVKMNISSIQRELGYDSANQSYDFDTRMVIQEGLLKRFGEIYASFSNMDVICDRTPLDLIGYTLLAVNDNLSEKQSEWLNLYIERCFEMANQYFTAVVLVQPGIPINDCETSAKSCLALIEKLNLIYMGAINDERLTISRFYLPRDLIKLDERVNACKNALARGMQRKILTDINPSKFCGVEYATATKQ